MVLLIKKFFFHMKTYGQIIKIPRIRANVLHIYGHDFLILKASTEHLHRMQMHFRYLFCKFPTVLFYLRLFELISIIVQNLTHSIGYYVFVCHYFQAYYVLYQIPKDSFE